MAPRHAELSAAGPRAEKCRAAERLSARSRSKRQIMEPGVTAARLFQCNAALATAIPTGRRRLGEWQRASRSSSSPRHPTTPVPTSPRPSNKWTPPLPRSASVS
ncbi:hypothetical protein MIC448_810023 [Microbacterium sp. C448]|nr:hypothetical protein MIC448_810023 [Microbacterium sp. C448]